MITSKQFREKSEREKIVMDGLLHFMKRTGMTEAQITKIGAAMPKFTGAFQESIFRVLFLHGKTVDEALEFTGPIPKKEMDRIIEAVTNAGAISERRSRQLLDATTAK